MPAERLWGPTPSKLTYTQLLPLLTPPQYAIASLSSEFHPSSPRPQSTPRYSSNSYSQALTMLSYDSPVAMNGQHPPAPNLSASIPPAPKVVRIPTPALPNGVHTNGVTPSVPQQPEVRHIWLVTGPAGCGKSTVAKFLATALEWPYIEGDEVCSHPSVTCVP